MVGIRPALDVYKHHGSGERSKGVFDVTVEIEVIIHPHGVPGTVRLNFDLPFQTHQRDGASNGVRRYLLAFGHAQAHDFEIRRADDRLRLDLWQFRVGEDVDHFP